MSTFRDTHKQTYKQAPKNSKCLLEVHLLLQRTVSPHGVLRHHDGRDHGRHVVPEAHPGPVPGLRDEADPVLRVCKCLFFFFLRLFCNYLYLSCTHMQ